MTESPGELSVEEGSAVCLDVVERVEEAVVIDRTVLFETLSAVIARGHVLIEDVPGTGKTVLARVLAQSLGLEFGRLQFTPDLLPADVTGSNVYNEHDRTFEFAEGPVFTNVVLADEINRAPPKTQAALLEAMEERQVSVDGTTHPLPEPFVVVATQNPVEHDGTFQLPEAQRDRFSVKTSLGYPDVNGEMGLLERRSNRRTIAPSVDPAVEPGTVAALQELAEDVRVDDKIRRYIIELARETRRDDRTEIGVSPRGVQRVFEAVRASAVIAAREYATPDDVKRLAEATMAHRLVLTTEATVDGVDPASVVRDAMDSVDVPAVSPTAATPGDRDGGNESESVAADEDAGGSVDREPSPGATADGPRTDGAEDSVEEPQPPNQGDLGRESPGPDDIERQSTDSPAPDDRDGQRADSPGPDDREDQRVESGPSEVESDED